MAVSVRTWTSALQRLQPLLVGDAEALLLVDDDEAEPLELDALGEHRVGADDDVDRAVGQAFLGRLGLGGGDEAREAADLDREACEALDEIADNAGARAAWSGRRPRPACPAIAATKAARSATSVLPKPTSPHDQPVHRLARGEIVEHVADRAVLIVGFLIGEAIDEGGVAAVIGLEHFAGAQRALGGGRDAARPRSRGCAPSSATCGAATPRRRACRASTPSSPRAVAARGRRDSRPARRACRRRHRSARRNRAALLPTGIGSAPRSGRCRDRHGRRDRRAMSVASSARKASAIFLRFCAADEPVAEHVLLGEQRDVGRGEAVIERQDDQRRMPLSAAPSASCQLSAERAPVQAVIGEQAGQPLARAVRIAGEDRLLARLAGSLARCVDDRLVDVGARGALGREIARADRRRSRGRWRFRARGTAWRGGPGASASALVPFVGRRDRARRRRAGDSCPARPTGRGRGWRDSRRSPRSAARPAPVVAGVADDDGVVGRDDRTASPAAPRTAAANAPCRRGGGRR